MIAPERTRYLAEIAETLREYRAQALEQTARARRAWAVAQALAELGEESPEVDAYPETLPEEGATSSEILALRRAYNGLLGGLDPELVRQLAAWPRTRERYRRESQSYEIRGREIPIANHVETLAGLSVPRVAVPELDDWGARARFLAFENLPGRFPFTSGVFPFKRTEEEEPARMFAGEGTPERTNRRFHLLCQGQPARRLSRRSTA